MKTLFRITWTILTWIFGIITGYIGTCIVFDWCEREQDRMFTRFFIRTYGELED